MAYRTNVKDVDQTDLETHEFSGGIPVFIDDNTTRIVKAAGGAANKKSGGVVMPMTSSGSITDFGDQPGKRCDSNGRPI